MSISRHFVEYHHFSQRNQSRLNKSFFMQPTVILVRRGRKILRWMGGEQIVQKGEIVLLSDNQSFDVINEPDEEGIYQVDWLSINPSVISRFAEQNTQQTFEILCHLSEHSLTTQAFERISQSISKTEISDKIVEIQLWELLTWLAERGGIFSCVSDFPLSKKIRKKIAEDTAYDWNIAKIADDFNVSEATLRRRLAQENTSFREILILVRMMRALSLLQFTQRPILQIAYEVGYESHSRFSATFKQHFGCLPSEVRQANVSSKLTPMLNRNTGFT